MEHITELIRARRSVRSFDGKGVSAQERQALLDFIGTIENPYNIPVSFRLLDAAEHGLGSKVIVGEELYVGARVAKVPHGEEAFGYAFEQLVLFAQSLGLGTTWIGGTMNRSLFEKAMELGDGERMPCVSPLGHPADKMSLRETMMRKSVKADERRPFEALFFDGDFDTPLSQVGAGALREPLEAVRLAPSAVNWQPWRAVRTAEGVHFYERRSKGFVSEAAGDLQKVDLGIALCHFGLTAKENGLPLRFALKDPGLPCPPNCEYIASFLWES